MAWAVRARLLPRIHWARHLEGAKAGLIPGAVEGYMSANPGQREYGAALGAVVGSGFGGTIGGSSIVLPKAMALRARKARRHPTILSWPR
jgi:hypothetical protein